VTAARRDALLIALTVSSGAVDAISFLGLGKVFTAFMTGNVVFLGQRTAGADGPDALRVALAFTAFGVGVFLAARMTLTSKGSGAWSPRVTAALGVAAVAQAAFVAIWAAVGGLPSDATGDVLVCVAALAMGIQSAAVMSLGVEGVFTTAATATLIHLASDLAGRSRSAVERRRLVGVLTGLFAGATAGALLLVHARAYAPVLPLVVTMGVIAAAARET
jgi:uncharacterized membrane protein YoaK (UPF0700 family)